MSFDSIASNLAGANPLENAPFGLGAGVETPELLNAFSSGSIASSLSKLSQVVGVALISQAAMKILQFGTRLSVPMASCLVSLTSSGTTEVQIRHHFTEIKNVLKEHASELMHIASLVTAAAMLIFGPPVTGYAGIALTLNILYMASKELKDSSTYRGLAESLNNLFQGGVVNVEEVLQTGIPEVLRREAVVTENLRGEEVVDEELELAGLRGEEAVDEELELAGLGLPLVSENNAADSLPDIEQASVALEPPVVVLATPLIQVSVDLVPKITLPSRAIMLEKLNAVINSTVLNEKVYQEILNEAGKQKEAMEAIDMFCRATRDFKKRIPEIIEVKKQRDLNSFLKEEEGNFMLVAMNYIEAIFGHDSDLLEKAEGHYLSSLESVRGFHNMVDEKLDEVAALSGTDIDL
ncbi:MAG: hypothetical protein ACI9S8_001670 [Chlamydiales bacterium]|jgi:hypothetical protein